MCLQNSFPKSGFVASCKQGVETEKMSVMLFIFTNKSKDRFWKRGRRGLETETHVEHTSGMQDSTTGAKKFKTYFCPLCLPCPHLLIFGARIH